jgi:Xaa-Pro aminopeptidase
MHTMHPTLLVGPADWDSARSARAVFDGRLAKLWESGAEGAIVYGEAAEHGALAYLTHFTPKLEPSLAFIPRDGAPILFFGGGPNMIGAAQPLTWVSDLRPMRNIGKAAADWVRTLSPKPRVLLIDGDVMPFGVRAEIEAALSSLCVLEDGSALLRAQMQRKSAAELAAIRGACARLDLAVSALRQAHAAGASCTGAVLAAEHVAQHEGAQDVRSLFSTDGGHTLRPFDIPRQERPDPLQVYLAVRYEGYWADGFVRVAHKEDRLGEKANALLGRMIAAAKAGVSARALAQINVGATAHPIVASMLGNGIGLSLEEAPLLTGTSLATLAGGGVYTLRAGVLDGDGAIASAMLLITDGGNEVLWSSTGER